MKNLSEVLFRLCYNLEEFIDINIIPYGLDDLTEEELCTMAQYNKLRELIQLGRLNGDYLDYVSKKKNWGF